VIVLLVRHARAGDREAWEGHDHHRPLDKKGRRHADELVEHLAEFPIDRVLSSPALRCTQTVMPLAAARGLEVEEVVELAEGSSDMDVLRLLGALDLECVAVCTHGDVIDELVGEVLRKGSTEVLELEAGRLSRVRHLGRPS
jgi:phosphohistidine phosphatase SixA